jgi:hypothetical protein
VGDASKATTCMAAAAAAVGCVAHQLAAGCAAGGVFALEGVKLGLVVQPINLPPVVPWGMP